MNDFDFNKSRLFLETMIEKTPENKDLIQAYVKLIEKKTEFDIAFFNGDTELRKDWEKNQTERIKADSEVAKKSIEKGVPSPRNY
jgi:molecular chaperone DnaK (HSP70)